MLAAMLLEVCKNPTQPGFNHYLFESVAALIRYGTAADAAMLDQFQEQLFPAFQVVLSVSTLGGDLRRSPASAARGPYACMKTMCLSVNAFVLRVRVLPSEDPHLCLSSNKASPVRRPYAYGGGAAAARLT